MIEKTFYSCTYDGLIVYAGPDASSPNLTHLCHRANNWTIVTSSGNHMMVHFYSDTTITGRGFSAVYSQIPRGELSQFLSKHSYDDEDFTMNEYFIFVGYQFLLFIANYFSICHKIVKNYAT